MQKKTRPSIPKSNFESSVASVVSPYPFQLPARRRGSKRNIIEATEVTWIRSRLVTTFCQVALIESSDMSITSALREINWRVFSCLFIAALAGVLAILPMAFEMFASGAFGEPSTNVMPLPLVAALALLQNGVLLAVAIAIGLVISQRVGLQMHLIPSWVNGERARDLKAVILPGMVLGAIVGVCLIAIEALFFLRQLPKPMQQLFEIPLWKRLLAGVVYGGITEELLMRLFLMSLVAWILKRVWSTPAGLPNRTAFWVAIVFVALLFGVGHLPATAVVTPLTPMIVARALVLNGVAGIAFGYLYWRHGLEAAMLGHMSTHLVMQGPGVMLLQSQL
jgi:membrane protease YdiL (CAAX protease family)